MKILAIRGSNLASLDGEFSIDFTSASFSQDGLIAITGATGSGKSTVLDALCLALFNRIPRLPSRGSQTLIGRADEDDKQRLASHDVRHILRRGTGEGYAEVDFLGVDQKKYRATWLVRRARKRPDGRFQTSEHLCISLQDKKPLGRTRKEIEDIIVEKLGLSFDQFRRSILLAQGDFASFLKSDAATRSRLLEMITGTEVYGEISRQAHQRANVEITKLDQYRIRLNEYETLDADARAILKDGLKQQEELLSHQQRDVTQWQEQLEQLQQLSQKIEQLKQAKADHVIQQSEWQNTEAIRNELQQLKQLQILRLPLQRFDDAQLALKDVRAQHKPLKQQCEKTQKQLTLIKETLDKQQLIYQAAESTFQHAKPKLHEAYKRDNQLHQAEKERQTLQMQEEESKHQLKALHYSLEANQSALQLSKSDQLTVNRWIEQHQSDAVLASQWQLWESLLDDAINKQVKQQQYQQQQVDLKQELKQTTEQQKTLQKNCDISQQTLATYEQALKELDEQKNQLQLDQCIAEIQSYNTNLIQLKELEKLQQQYCDNQAEQLSIKKDLEQLQNSIHHAKMIQKKSEKQLRESDIRLDEASRKNQRALLANG